MGKTLFTCLKSVEWWGTKRGKKEKEKLTGNKKGEEEGITQ